MGNLNVVGLGPGNKDNMTFRAYDALIRSDYLVGYTNYIKLIPKEITGKEIISTGMGDEVLRCEQALEKANEGYEVSLVCSGDSVIYGMASLCYELINKYKNHQTFKKFFSKKSGDFSHFFSFAIYFFVISL